MSIFKQKGFFLAPVIVLVIAFMFSLPAASSIHAAPKNLPIALLNLDQGPISQKLMGQLAGMTEQAKAKGETMPFQLTSVANMDTLTQKLKDQAFYGALVITDSFTQDVGSIASPQPKPAAIKLLINQGMNTSGVTAATQVLQTLTDQMNVQLRAQLLKGMEEQGKSATTVQVQALSSPIKKTVEYVNPLGDNAGNGSAPTAMFQPLWMSVMLGSVLVFMITRKLSQEQRLSKGTRLASQLVLGLILACIAGYSVPLTMQEVVGLNIPSFAEVTLFLMISYYSFYVMILALMTWIGPGAIALFLLLFFFGLPVLTLAPEMIPTVAYDWLYTWLPMRFTVEGLRDMMYFDAGLGNSDLAIILWIGLGSIVLLGVSLLKPERHIAKKSLDHS